MSKTPHVEGHMALFFRMHINNFGMLHDRWQDEREYEDWSQYEAVVRGWCEKVQNSKVKFLRGTSRPFKFYFECGDWRYEVHVTIKRVELRAIGRTVERTSC